MDNKIIHFIQLLISSFHKYMLNSHCVPNIILGVDNMDTS